MDIGYKDKSTQKLCEDAEYASKKLPPKVVTNLQELMYKLSVTATFDKFQNNPANKKYRIHKLQGDKKELIALKLDYQYRMTIKILVTNINNRDEITIWEVSNHYGD